MNLQFDSDVQIGQRVRVGDGTQYGELDNHVGTVVSVLPDLKYGIGVRVLGHGVMALRPRDLAIVTEG